MGCMLMVNLVRYCFDLVLYLRNVTARQACRLRLHFRQVMVWFPARRGCTFFHRWYQFQSNYLRSQKGAYE